MFVSRLLVGLAVASLCGCANLNTVGRSTPLGGGSVAVHLDAPQRVVISNGLNKVCAEPSPDALQAYASSLGASYSAPSKQAISLAQALSSSAGSIGLRTQAITLMRDGMYRICELYFSGALSEGGALQLLERSQDLSLGILAIEQLTGAVVAQQVVLGKGSAATAAASLNDIQKQIDIAKSDEATKKTAAETAQSEAEDKKNAVSTKNKEADNAEAAAKFTQAEVDDLSPKVTAAADDLQQQMTARQKARSAIVGLQSKQKSSSERVTTQKKELESRKKVQADAEALLVKANAAVPLDQAKVTEATNARDASVAAVAKKTAEVEASAAELTKATSDLRTAAEASDAADQKVSQAQDAFDAVTAQLKSVKEDPLQVAWEAASTALNDAKEQVNNKQAAVDSAKKSLEQAQANTQRLEKLGDAASSSVEASTSDSAAFLSGGDNHYGVNKDTVDALSNATTQIVQLVLNKGHLTDSCTALFFAYARRPDELQSAIAEIMPICRDIIDATLVAYRAANSAPLGPAGSRSDDQRRNVIRGPVQPPPLQPIQ